MLERKADALYEEAGVEVKQRYVRSAAGARRFGLPIGSPIPEGGAFHPRGQIRGAGRAPAARKIRAEKVPNAPAEKTPRRRDRDYGAPIGVQRHSGRRVDQILEDTNRRSVRAELEALSESEHDAYMTARVKGADHASALKKAQKPKVSSVKKAPNKPVNAPPASDRVPAGTSSSEYTSPRARERAQYAALTPTQKRKYDAAIFQGASHSVAMGAAMRKGGVAVRGGRR